MILIETNEPMQFPINDSDELIHSVNFTMIRHHPCTNVLYPKTTKSKGTEVNFIRTIYGVFYSFTLILKQYSFKYHVWMQYVSWNREWWLRRFKDKNTSSPPYTAIWCCNIFNSKWLYKTTTMRKWNFYHFLFFSFTRIFHSISINSDNIDIDMQKLLALYSFWNWTYICTKFISTFLI